MSCPSESGETHNSRFHLKTEFTDGRVGIRPYRQTDIPLLFEAVRESIDELSAWMPWCTPSYSLEDSREFASSRTTDWDKGEHYSFVIEDQNTGQFLGGTGVNFVNLIHNFANLGYWVRTSATGRGVASKAVRLVAQFGLQELRLSRLEILAAVGNVASQHVADKAGARREGVLRKRLQLHGQALDAVLFSLVVEDLSQ